MPESMPVDIIVAVAAGTGVLACISCALACRFYRTRKVLTRSGNLPESVRV
jgi:hypothetical protein